MRDFLVLAIIFAAVPLCLFNPFFGILMWYWIAYFNPHRFTWSYAYNFPVAYVIAIPTLLGTLIHRKSLRTLAVRESLVLMALWLWCVVTYLHATGIPLFAGHMEDSRLLLEKFSKILLMTFTMLLVITSRQRLRILFLLTALCFGLLAVKAALFGIRTGGAARVLGPPDSFIGDNNGFGLAMNMSLPFFFFLARSEENRWMRRLLRLFFVCGILVIILTYSRGALVGLAAVLAAITFKARKKLLGSALLAVCALLILTLAPAGWTSRMDEFFRGNLDQSAQQRLIGWRTAWNIAMDYPVTGGGFDTLPDVEVFQRYKPEPLPGLPAQGPHSIYFQFLVDHGFVGLGLFLFFVGSCLFRLRSLRRRAREQPETNWMVDYTDMLETSLIGFLTTGAFLGLGYFDFFYQVAASAAVLKVLYDAQLKDLIESRATLAEMPPLHEALEERVTV